MINPFPEMYWFDAKKNHIWRTLMRIYRKNVCMFLSWLVCFVGRVCAMTWDAKDSSRTMLTLLELLMSLTIALRVDTISCNGRGFRRYCLGLET